MIRRVVPARFFAAFEYHLEMGKKLDLKEPHTLSEKVQWLKLNDRNPMYVHLMDKYEVRHYIRSEVGEQYLIPLIGLYNTVDEIPFDDLPGQFVIKCTHDSGSAVFKNAANKISAREIMTHLAKALKENYYYQHREWGYKDIRPRIICEQLIHTKDNNQPRDYKFFCFDGEPRFLVVVTDRATGAMMNFYDLEWNVLPVTQHYPPINYVLDPPGNFDTMIAIAKKLSQGFRHMRVDLYLDAEENIFVGELTFYHFAGIVKFEPEEYDEYFGRFFHLPIQSQKK
ncbi:MAG: ATP-grasp fold amidoligase family protein [Syntrophomonadaceae bacterium]